MVESSGSSGPSHSSGSSKASGKSRIGVYARIKPTTSHEERGDISVRDAKRGLIMCTTPHNSLEFALDEAFDSDASQESVYDVVGRQRVAGILDGFDATVLAYGQTGSGKTHTMFGPDEVMEDFGTSDPAEHGIVPRACDHLFSALREAPPGSTWLVECGYLEVYNDRLFDLLNGRAAVTVKERPGCGGASAEGLTHEPVASTDDAIALLARGNAQRVTAAMRMNPRSSRGHALLIVSVKQLLGGGGERGGKLTLVDLAGMESSKKSYAVEGASGNPARRGEAKNINQSLYALGSVVERLSATQRGNGSEHIPFRDAKLTRLLQESMLGGATAIVVTLRAEVGTLDETIGTLRFAQRARAVQVRVGPNDETLAPAQLQRQLLEARAELGSMRAQMATLHASRAVGGEGEVVLALRAELEGLKQSCARRRPKSAVAPGPAPSLATAPPHPARRLTHDKAS